MVFREAPIKPLVGFSVTIQRVKETVASLQEEEPLSFSFGPLFFDPLLKDLQYRDLLTVRKKDARTFFAAGPRIRTHIYFDIRHGGLPL